MSRSSFTVKLFVQVLRKAKFGSVSVTFPDGDREIFGEGELKANVIVKRWAAIEQLFKKGDIGLAEAIIEDTLQVDDTTALVEWACLNDQSLANAIHGTWYGTFLFKLKHLMNQNTKSKAKKNIMAHYDLGNDFYKQWLDESMTYSSALFQSPDETLKQAQMNKYNRLIDQLGIKSGDHVLEVGCGWGGFFSQAVERTGCKVTAVMNSPSQAKHNRELIKRKGMQDHVDLQEIDYRDIQGKYDKVVSIEMIEAVGEKYWGSYFSKLSNSLKSKGEALVQAITIEEKYFYSYRQKTDFIQTYVFPGGMLLTNEVFKNMSLKNQMNLDHFFEFGLSYAETLKMWRQRFILAKEELSKQGFDEKFFRLWNLYLCYCEGAFRAQRINVGQFKMVKI